jgi:hypothetical protein
VLLKPTTEGVSRLPSLLMITVGLPPSITATTEFVVPKSIPIAFAITITSFLEAKKKCTVWMPLLRRGIL